MHCAHDCAADTHEYCQQTIKAAFVYSESSDSGLPVACRVRLELAVSVSRDRRLGVSCDLWGPEPS